MSKKYPLFVVEKLRHNREEKAIFDFKKAIQEQEKCEQVVQEKKKAHQEFLIWCAEESDRLLNELMEQSIHRFQLDDVLKQIGLNKEGEASYLQAISEAENTLQVATKKVEETQNLKNIASAALRRIQEHKNEWNKKVILAEERAEELELEDIAEIRFRYSRL